MEKRLKPNDPLIRGSRHLTEAEVAEWLNVSTRTLQGWRLKGGGPEFQKFGRSVRYADLAVEAWIAERKRSSTTASCSATPWGIHRADLLPESGKGERS